MSPQPPKVLIVEYLPPLRERLAHLFAQAGYDVATTGSGESALDLLSTLPLALVVLDLGLPGVQGLEVIRRVRERGSDLIGVGYRLDLG